MSRAWRHFARHFLEMLLAMLIGMAALGWPAYLLASPAAALLVMATAMAAPMAAWMWHRAHPWARIAEMAGAMLVPAMALIVLHAAGAVPGEAALDALHGAMVPAMLVAMLLRREEYSSPVPAGRLCPASRGQTRPAS